MCLGNIGKVLYSQCETSQGLRASPDNGPWLAGKAEISVDNGNTADIVRACAARGGLSSNKKETEVMEANIIREWSDREGRLLVEEADTGTHKASCAWIEGRADRCSCDDGEQIEDTHYGEHQDEFHARAEGSV